MLLVVLLAHRVLHAATSTLCSDHSYKYEGPRLTHAVCVCAEALCTALQLKIAMAGLAPMIFLKNEQFSSVQFSRSVMSDSLQPHATCQASLSITDSQSSLRLMSIKSVMSSSHLILCCPLLLLPPIPPSIRVFQ